uniref:Sugar transporter SWEET n=1 Tax=Strongyloides papillosus TaxID=174720 RepID=A0A0N5CHC6_STREA
MNGIELFGLWLAVFSIGFTFLPIFQVLEWKKRGTSDGFSSISLVLPMLMMSCWFKHGVLTNDKNNMLINGVNLVCFTFYVSIFAYYQSKRRNVALQVVSLLTTVYFIFNHVNNTHPDKAPDVMGSIAAGTQIFGMVGGIYDLLRAMKLGTMEYIPAVIQFAMFVLISQWTLFGYLIGNQYMFIANVAGLALNIITLGCYFIYPPLTWKVPIFGIEPQQKTKTDKKKQ